MTTQRFLQRVGARRGAALRLVVATGLVAPWATASQAQPLETPEPPARRVEVGVGYVSDDSAKFGRFNGRDQEKAHAVGDLDLHLRQEDGLYGTVRGTDLGLDSRYLRLEGGRQGRIEGFLEFDQTDVRNSDSAVTPFNGTGSDRLQLPAPWTRGATTAGMTQLNSSLRSVDLGTERKRYGGGLSLVPRRHWRFDVSYHHETKEGTGRIGGATAFLQGSSILPAPIDYETDQIEATVGYVREKGQLELSYRYSAFDNRDTSLTWDNPYTTIVADRGRLALAPDNESHQVSLSAGYRLPLNTRVTGMLSAAVMRQDETFLPFSTVGLGGTPPQGDLNGRVYIKTGRLQVHSRPLPKWAYTVSLKFYDRDNDTDKADYPYVVADFVPLPARRSQPYSFRKKQVQARADYRLSRDTRLSLEYAFDDTSRTLAEVDNTHEHRLEASARLRPRQDLSATLRLAGAWRNESGNYNPVRATTNPALRLFHLAERRQAKAGLKLSYTPIPQLSLAASADYVRDRYSDTEIGLKDSTHPTYSLDATYTPSEAVTTYAFYTYDNTDTKQTGSAAGNARDWTADVDDASNTLGLGFKWSGILHKIDLGGDYVYTKGKSQVDLRSNGDFTDLVDRLHTVSLYGQYRYNKTLDLRLTYRHDNFRSKDPAIDGVAPDTIDQVLSLGETSPDYDVDVVTLSLIYRM